MAINWSSVVALVAVLGFFYLVLRILLKEKSIGLENTIRFAALIAGVILALALVFLPVANPTAASGLIGVIGAIIGYVIRDAASLAKKD